MTDRSRQRARAWTRGLVLDLQPDLGLVVVLTGEEEALQDGAPSGRPVVRGLVVPAFAG